MQTTQKAVNNQGPTRVPPPPPQPVWSTASPPLQEPQCQQPPVPGPAPGPACHWTATGAAAAALRDDGCRRCCLVLAAAAADQLCCPAAPAANGQPGVSGCKKLANRNEQPAHRTTWQMAARSCVYKVKALATTVPAITCRKQLYCNGAPPCL